MRWLVLVAMLSGTAHADDRETELAAALAKGDTATLQAVAGYPVYVYGLWFDTEPCRVFAGAKYTLVSEREFPALVACIAGLEPRPHPKVSGAVLYGAGSLASVQLQDEGGRQRLRAIMGADPRQIEGDAAPIDGAIFGPRTAKFWVPVPRKLRARIDKTRELLAKADLRVCFDTAGKVDAVTLLAVDPGVPEFGKLSVDTARRWKVKPFLARGIAVRACGTVLTAYPASRVTEADRVNTATRPPPPPTPTP